MAEYHVFVVSDGTGETATKMSKAALLQFTPRNTIFTRHSNVRSIEMIREVVKDAQRDRALVIHTFATQELRRAMEEACQDRNVPSHDLLGSLFETLKEFFGIAPSEKPGLLHQVDDDYFERIDALSFTVRHDETRSADSLHEAEIVLVGVSRTSKTPLSVYLAQEGWKVANIPVVIGEKLPEELFQLDQSRIVGLMITPERLAEVRKARLSRLGTADSTYADLKRVNEELEYCRKIFDQNPRWLRVDVTGKSVEEIASEILDKIVGKERRLQ
jgi:[pyruvate, water dikinase]-phosphate phosphotransferase / [pyruvate, water dikinase] kinase